MSDFENILTDSDLTAYKNGGAVLTASMTFSGVIAGGGSQIQTSASLQMPSPDLGLFLFDNNQKHSGKFKSIILEGVTMIFDSTSPGDNVCELNVKVDSGFITFRGEVFNPYSFPITLQTTTLNFRYMPYIATL